MDLKVRDVARLLNVSEKTVHRWAKNGELPTYLVHDQYLFNRVEIQEWATARNHPVSPEIFSGEGTAATQHGLAEAIERGDIYYGVPGETREQVLANVILLPGIPERVDRALLGQLLVSREAIASTGMGDGIAIPHPRDPLVVDVTGARILVCFLASPIDFQAPDGKPVRVLFTLFTPSVASHLRTLSQLAFALHDRDLKRLLVAVAPRDEILARVRAIDAAGATARGSTP